MQLKRCHTMKRAGEFAQVRARGVSHAGRFLVLSTLPLSGEQPATRHSLFGLITTKRLGHAVYRNRLRRQMRELLRAHGEPISAGLYVVIILRQRAVHADYHELERDLLKLIHRAQQPLASPR